LVHTQTLPMLNGSKLTCSNQTGSIHIKTFYECNIHISLQKENGKNIMDIVISLILYRETLKMQW